MDISLIAGMKTYDEFISEYSEGDELKEYDGRSLAFYSISNNDPESRYKITKFLIERNVPLSGVNDNNENMLHILLSRRKHNLQETLELCRAIISGGADINQLDKQDRVPLQYLINMKYSDEDLEPLYELWLSFDNLLVSKKNAWGKSPLELVKVLPYRENFYRRLKRYE